ncbi:MAG: hypothetical protein R3Y21_02155 [Mycoplasmatota bacterium]
MNLFETESWNVLFSIWEQDYIGRCIICNKNNKPFLSSMSPKEWEELGYLEKILEDTCKSVFGATMFNFECLMNNAYKDNETPSVHIHFSPRYKEKVNIFNKVYKDKHFGYNFHKWQLNKFKCQKDIFSKEERTEIYFMMKKEIESNHYENITIGEFKNE